MNLAQPGKWRKQAKTLIKAACYLLPGAFVQHAASWISSYAMNHVRHVRHVRLARLAVFRSFTSSSDVLRDDHAISVNGLPGRLPAHIAKHEACGQPLSCLASF